MTLQGAELAIGRLHPEFVVRLANAIREARSAGLPFAGVFSAYRPPAFGVGGFSDKFNSLHTYGLAVDMFAKNVDGRIDDPNAGWKGKGLWTTTGTRTFFHNEGGKQAQPKAIKIQMRPSPLAN